MKINEEILRIKEVMGIVNEQSEETYSYGRIYVGDKWLTFKELDKRFEPSDTSVIRFVGNDGEYTFQPEQKVMRSNNRENEAYTLKSNVPTKVEEVVNCDNYQGDFNKETFKKKLQEFYNVKYNFKFRNTPLQSLWSKNETEPSEKQISELENGLNILKRVGKLDENEKQQLKEIIIQKNKFVLDDDGNWLSINKITGNRVQYVEIITEVVFKNINDKEAKEIYCNVINGENPNTIINETHKTYLENKINELGFDWLKGQTKKIDLYSRSGLKTEENFNVLLFLKYPGHKVLFEGGDGNLVDINLSIDMIVDFGPEYGVKTIQIKNNKTGVDKLLSKYNTSSYFYKYLDWVIYPEGDNWLAIDLSTGESIEL